MNEILKDPVVYPKVQLSEDEYNNLVRFARMNADEIERRAVELYRTNGVCRIEIDARIDKQKERWSSDDTTEKLEYKVNAWRVNNDEEYAPQPFAITADMVKRIKRAANDMAYHAFRFRFGEHLTEINNILALKRDTERLRKRFIIATVTGWLVAVALLIVAVLK